MASRALWWYLATWSVGLPAENETSTLTAWQARCAAKILILDIFKIF